MSRVQISLDTEQLVILYCEKKPVIIVISFT